MIDAITNLAPVINAVSTVVLVIVTGVYAYLTWGMVRETRRARKQEVTPVMNLDVEPFSIGAWAPKIENIGNGPAIDVNGTVKLHPDGEEHEIQTKNIPSGDFTGSLSPNVSENTHEEYESLVVEGSYRDVFGDRDTFKETYELDLLAKLDGADSMMKRDQQERHLRSIDNHLKSIAGSIEMDGLEKVLKMESRGRLLEELREHDSLTLRELASQTGMTPFEIGVDLTWLNEAGAVEYDVDRGEIFDEENLDVEIRVEGGNG
ncbi:helix-turn-helix transcriptional regulator [Halorussus marinus]|uniref:helix-turn-helix transcriptional regulator n=1 Tax=Halorussus marinus TaxID=2505976 RepID=UPI00106DD360|nr:helix-turn-helix transcriptional regulator [Halorussus marinus]